MTLNEIDDRIFSSVEVFKTFINRMVCWNPLRVFGKESSVLVILLNVYSLVVIMANVVEAWVTLSGYLVNSARLKMSLCNQ